MSLVIITKIKSKIILGNKGCKRIFWEDFIIFMQKVVSTRREKEHQLHYEFTNIFTLQSKKISKMLINGTSPRSPHFLETGSKLKYSLLHVLRINGALPHLLHLPFQVLILVYGSSLPFCTSTFFSTVSTSTFFAFQMITMWMISVAI